MLHVIPPHTGQNMHGFKDEQLMTWHLIDHHIISQLKHNFLSILKQKLSGVHIRRCGEMH